jgi:hypothetical protein
MATVSTDWKPTQGKRHGEFSEGLSGFYLKAWRVSREAHKNLGDPKCSCISVHWKVSTTQRVGRQTETSSRKAKDNRGSDQPIVL